MKLEHLNEAAAAVSTAVGIPLETRIRLGMLHAEAVVKSVRCAAMTAMQAKVAGTLTEDLKEAILEQLWDELVSPS